MSVGLPEVVAVGRGDDVYMAHAYLTKVPVTAITPFIEAYTKPGDVVLDAFAGSGMTGVAAAITGRTARLVDISRLGRHIGENYLNLVDGGEFAAAAALVIKGARARLGDVYAVTCTKCGEQAELSKAICSAIVPCLSCGKRVVYYEALEAVGFHKPAVCCTSCSQPMSLKTSRRDGDKPVIDVLTCSCSKRFVEQSPSDPLYEPNLSGLRWPDVEIHPDRQMYQASALGRHGLVSTSKFFTPRNLAVLAALKEQIDGWPDAAVRRKLTFVLTGVLARASMRYQWSTRGPLNAANQTYYVAPVFYEWNVYDLFARKVRAVLKSDAYIREQRRMRGVTGDPDATYVNASAHALPLADNSVDYVFTDPPFGSNIFYSDMNLFQEAWLGEITDHEHEAVVDRAGSRGADRYEELLTGALRECRRVLRSQGRLSLVFSNSSGALWALLQRAVLNAGFEIDESDIHLLDKGQRSVKGLASGFEDVVTMDLILTMRSRRGEMRALHSPSAGEIAEAVKVALLDESANTATHVYLGLLRFGLSKGWSLADLDFRLVTRGVQQAGFKVDSVTSRFERA